MDAKSIILRTIGLLGMLLFGILFSITLLSTESIENSARSFVKTQIEKELRHKLENISQSIFVVQASKLAEKFGLESDQIKHDLQRNLPEKIAQVISAMCGYDCEKKKALADSIAAGYLERIKNINVAQKTLGDLIKGKYLEVVSNLKIDLRIFLGSNFIMFLALVLISFAKPQAISHLFLPCLLLFISTVLSTLIYVFGQDWFYTIVYNDYMGCGYLVYIVLIFGVLLDISLNKARVTTQIINGIAHGVGSAFSVVPC